MTEFKLPDPKKTSGKVLGIGLAIAAGLGVWYYLLPFLLTVVWGTLQLGIAAAAVVVLGMVVLNPTFWRRLRLVLNAIGEMSFKWFVEMNSFTILQMQLDKAEEDREGLLEQQSKLQGQKANLQKELFENEKAMKQSAAEMQLCQQNLASNPNDVTAAELMERASTIFTNSKDFVDTVKPIYTDIERLTEFLEKAYRKSGLALENARTTVRIKKATYDAATAGSNAMQKALRAFKGDPDLEKGGKYAMDKLQADIANKIGTIKSTLKITTDIMNQNDLRDAAKVSMATETIKQLNIDQAFKYEAPISVENTNIPVTNKGNKYLNNL